MGQETIRKTNREKETDQYEEETEQQRHHEDDHQRN